MEALRSLLLEDLDWTPILLGFLVVAVAGAIMLAISIRVIRAYD
jgi:ABC-2 type transport system permease protein